MSAGDSSGWERYVSMDEAIRSPGVAGRSERSGLGSNLGLKAAVQIHDNHSTSGRAPAEPRHRHLRVLERAGLVTTRKVGRVRTCTLGPRRFEDETAWIERQRRLWDERFDELERIVGERRRKEQIDGRTKRA